jgi:cytochrome c oxidase assembly protein subunit 15
MNQMPRGNDPWLHRFTLVTAFFTFLLIIAGALVTGNEAGLAVPDWPLSYGSLMPPMVGNIRYEHGHRMIATFVGFLTTLLAIGLWLREPRRSVRKLGFIALVVVIAQGILGGITVLFFLPTAISVSHACLAQAFFCIMVSLALMTSPSWKREETQLSEDRTGLPLRRLCAVTTGTVYLQLILGAALRHSKSGILLHILGAVVVTFFVIWVVARIFRYHQSSSSLFRTAVVLGLMLPGQLFLGMGSYLIRLATRNDVQPGLPVVSITTAHVAVGALILATSLILTLRSYRVMSGPSKVIQFSPATQKVAS